MSKQIQGIHHVTAIAGDPQRNLDFYAGVLGLRLVKLTINYDDPGTYHLYYGDYSGQPGTLITFFPWLGVPRGRAGSGQVVTTSFSIPEGSLDYWKTRFSERGVSYLEDTSKFGDHTLAVQDYDGMNIEVTSSATDPRPGWPGGPVPNEHAIRGFHAATFAVGRLDRSVDLLGGTMGFSKVDSQGDRYRFQAPGNGPGSIIDLVETPPNQRALQGAGSVHHIAWRTADDAEQVQWQSELLNLGYQVSPVMDRTYFHSIYYREPSGILYEIATDRPGFAVDEPLESLGSKLVLPAWLEPERAEVERVLPKLTLPEVQHA